MLDRAYSRAGAETRALRAHREALVVGPTPLQRLDRLRDALGGGPRLWVKRDDLTGLALGGNKARKLEYLLAEARARDADTLVTVGAAQSNHARQTAAAAAQAGLDAVLVLRVPQQASKEYLTSGNLLLDSILGARVLLVEEEPEDLHPERAAAAAEVERLRAEGRRPFLIPSGGSTPVGVLGYLECYAEIAGAGVGFEEIVVGSGSGGTQAGLIAGRELLPQIGRPRIHGVAVAPGADGLAGEVAELAGSALASLAAPQPRGPVVVDPGHAGSGYGVPTETGTEAIELFARTEGVLLDPVYTAKAAAALLFRVRQGVYPDDADVLFLHTGGAPALFAYPDGASAGASAEPGAFGGAHEPEGGPA